MTKRKVWQRNAPAQMLENIRWRWELLTNGVGYQSQSEQHRVRRPSSEDSCKPNSKTKIGRKQGQEQFWYQRKQKKTNYRWKATAKRTNDGWKATMTPRMTTSMMMAYHNGAWTCPTPFHMEDWTHRDMYHIKQGFGSIFIWYESGSKVFWPKNSKNFQLKKKIWIKNYNLHSSS